MKTTKKLGIWMDHASAHIIELGNTSQPETIVTSTFTHAQKEASMSKSEQLMHNREQQEEGAYYKQLGLIIDGYDDVLLFGPTDAKTELFNVLRANKRFDEIHIETKQTERMTDNQEHAFVQAHFMEQ